MAKSTTTKGDPKRDGHTANSPRTGDIRPPNRTLHKPEHLAPAKSNTDNDD